MNPPINSRYLTGRRLMLSAAIMYSIVHALGYLPTAEPRNLPANWTSISTFISPWVWAGAWALTAVVGAVELARGKGVLCMSLVVGIMGATAAAFICSYIITVIEHGWGSREWWYFGTYLFMLGIVSGLQLKVRSLKRGVPHD